MGHVPPQEEVVRALMMQGPWKPWPHPNVMLDLSSLTISEIQMLHSVTLSQSWASVSTVDIVFEYDLWVRERNWAYQCISFIFDFSSSSSSFIFDPTVTGFRRWSTTTSLRSIEM